MGENNSACLADLCGELGIRIPQSDALSDRVCMPCARKIRNAHELYGFIEAAVWSTLDNVDEGCDSPQARFKRQLPTMGIMLPYYAVYYL